MEDGAKGSANSVNPEGAYNRHNLLDNQRNGVDNGVEDNGSDHLASNAANDRQVGDVLGGLDNGSIQLGDGVLDDLHLLGPGSLRLGDDGDGASQNSSEDLNHMDKVSSSLEAGNMGQREDGGGGGLGGSLILGDGGGHSQRGGGSNKQGSDVDHCEESRGRSERGRRVCLGEYERGLVWAPFIYVSGH